MKRIIIICLVLAGIVALFAEKAKIKDEIIQVFKPVTSGQLGGSDRYSGYVTLDKPLYKGGDIMYIRAILLDAEDNEPYTGLLSGKIIITGPRGETIREGFASGNEGYISCKVPVASHLGGGQYKVKVTLSNRDFIFAAAERAFEIRSYRAPRLKTEITFLKDGYLPGEVVKAFCTAERAEGGSIDDPEVIVSARVDGKEVYKGQADIDQTGVFHTTFTLPSTITKGEGTIIFTVKDGGVVETASKTLPILIDNYTIDFYPEGGDLVYGIKNKVYVEVKFDNGKPADVSGHLVASKKNVITKFSTVHEGRGHFFITPEKGKDYSMRVSRSKGKFAYFALPKGKDSGISLQSIKADITGHENISLELYTTHDRKVLVTLSKNEKEMLALSADLKKNKKNKVSMPVPTRALGVLRMTVWENGVPLAERLVFKHPKEKVFIDLELEKETYSPGDTVTLKVKTRDGQGRPVPAMVGITVTDDAVKKIIEKRDLPPDLPVMVFLEDQVKELKNSGEYLDPGVTESSRNLDLLLATQGWRRFAFVKWDDFIADDQVKAMKMVSFCTKNHVIKKQMEGLGALRGNVREFRQRKGKAVFNLAAEERFLDRLEDKLVPNGMAIKEDNKFKDIGLERLDAEKVLKKKEFFAEVEKATIAAPGYVIVREYSHKRRNNWKASERIDFTETVFWSGGIKTDDKKGSAEVVFDLNDSLTSFSVSADAISSTGALAAKEITFNSVKPFYIEPKMPLEITRGDKVFLPLALVNNTGSSLKGKVEIMLDEKKLTQVNMEVNARERKGAVLELDMGSKLGVLDLTVKASFGNYADQVQRSLIQKGEGFPIEISRGGILSSKKDFVFTLNIPSNIKQGSLKTDSTVYLSPQANLTRALQALIRQPNGCFEQTSSTSYPLVMAQQYFLSHSGVDPKFVKQSRNNLVAGYKRLIGFECSKKGYEWFGGNPGHEALTAYGLMQFNEMKEVMDVDPGMINRTQKWLLSRRDGKGGFKRNERALDSFGRAPEHTTDTYITWALISADMQDLDKEIKLITERSLGSDDAYIISLAANILYKTGYKGVARKLMDRLVKKQEADGHVSGADTSITRSRGESLKIETTSLAVLAWLQDENYAFAVEKAIRYIIRSSQDGMFYSTQGTILALKAILAYDRLKSSKQTGGEIVVLVNGKKIGESISYSAKDGSELKLPDISSALTSGKQEITIKMKKGSELPVSFYSTYYSLLPADSDECRMQVEAVLTKSKINEGDGTELMVTVRNKTDEVVPTPIAIIGIPGGLDVRHEQLKELIKKGEADAYEVRGRELVLYWRGFRAGEKRTFPIGCTGGIPGTYTAPASRTYEYYASEYKNWAKGETVFIMQ